MEVLQVYNKTWSKGIFHFSYSDSATLYSIAYQNPNQSGSAVYLARNMLGLTLVDFGQTQAAKMSNTVAIISEASEADNVLVYPNPASSQITIEFENQLNQCDITIFNIFGQTIMNQNMSGNTKYNLTISNLEAGMYFYSIVSDGKVVKSGKFIKQ
jgi:hypothetical protein